MMDFITPIILLCISGVFTVLWYLLKRKDETQEHQIDMLFDKHDRDAESLAELRLQIAEGHYKKGELDVKFDKLENTFKNGFDEMGRKFDKLSEVLIAHMRDETKGGHQ